MSRWFIPKSWCWVTALDIAKIIGGGTPSTKNPANFTTKGISWITPSDLSNYKDEYISRGSRDLSEEGYNSCGAQLMPRDTVLFTSRAPVGYCVLAANEICTNQGFKNLILKGKIDPKFIRHYLLFSKDYAESLASGSTFKELSGKRMAALEFPIPPINEQKRIIAKIEELQTHSRQAREALETIPDLLEQLRQSILAAAFRGDLTQKWREQHKGRIEPAAELLKRIRIERRKRWEAAELDKLKAKGLAGDQLDTQFAKRRKQYQEPAPVDTTDLPELPKGWCWASLEEISEWVTDGTHQPPPLSEDGIPFLVISNMMSGEIAWDTINKWVSFDTFDRFTGNYKPYKGDVIYSTVGSYGVAVEIQTNKKFMFQRHIAHIRPISNLFLPAFLTLFLNSHLGKSQADKAARGVAQKTVNLSDLRRFALPLASLQEQKKITEVAAKFLRKVGKQRMEMLSLSTAISQIDQSVLIRAFRGELVLQDPNDEPASILLERIRQEKERQATASKAKPKQEGRKMKRPKTARKDIIAVLQEAARPMTPEELFSAGGFGEDSVDAFYEQLRAAITAKKIRETRKGATIKMEALP